jgi:hypothetical protein
VVETSLEIETEPGEDLVHEFLWFWWKVKDAPGTRKKILVAIFQRGAADGLNIVVPHAEKRYYEMRPTIAIPRPAISDKENSAIDLDGFFGLHPALAPLQPIYEAGHLGVVHAAGSPDPTRSHFDAQDYMESGTPGYKATSEAGWPSRRRGIQHLAGACGDGSYAAAPSTNNAGGDRVNIPGAWRQRKYLKRAAGFRYRPERHGTRTFDAVKLLHAIEKQPYHAGAEYPKGRLGDSLQQIARLIKSDVGVEVAFADVGGWDHHVNEVGQRPSQGQLAQRLAEFGQSLAAFWKDLGDRMADVVLVTMSEFGRTARENGNRGTDHGHANVMFVMGGEVRGGKAFETGRAWLRGIPLPGRPGADHRLVACSVNWSVSIWYTVSYRLLFWASLRRAAAC